MPLKSERNEAGTDASKIRGTQKGTVSFLFRSFCIRIGRKFRTIIQKSTIIFISYCLRVIISWEMNHKLKMSNIVHFLWKIVVAKRKFRKWSRKGTVKGTEKERKRNGKERKKERRSSLQKRNGGRNDCLNFDKGTRQERVPQIWGTVNALM